MQLVRAALRGASLFAPAAAEKAGVELFFRPRRPGARAPGTVNGQAPREHTVISGDYRLAAWSWGEGPTVLLVHGWEGRATQLTGFAGPLVAAGYRVVSFDMPAHGRSSGSRVTVLDMARAVRDVAEDTAPLLGLSGVRPAPLHGIVAHSLGGAAAVLAMHQGLSARRAVLLAPSAEPTFFARKAASFLQLSPPVTQGMIRRVEDELGDLHALDARVLARGFDAPALVMHDPEDTDVPIDHGRGLADAWPGARFVALQGLGHRRLLRDAEVIRAAAQFLSAADDN